MECCMIFCFFAFFVASTQARSLSAGSTQSNARRVKAFQAFEARFLQMMGMKEKPREARNVVVPQYMLDLYDSHVPHEEYVSTNFNFKDFATTANTVRAFYHSDLTHKASRGSRSKRHVHLDIGSVPSHEEFVKAEFRVYSSRSGAVNPFNGSYLMNIYQITSPNERKLLDRRVINASSEGWQSYDILEAARHWHKTPSENHGLELEIMTENGHPIDISHLSLDKPRELDEQQWPHQRPLLALFSHDAKTHYHKRRVRRNASHRGRGKGLCKRRELVVNFQKQLKWNWIYRPLQYDAYMCQGKCVYPMANHMNATNHAIVQTLVHSVGKSQKKYGKLVPPACCVPTELDAVMLLYFNKSEIVIKSYADMRVIGCGCR